MSVARASSKMLQTGEIWQNVAAEVHFELFQGQQYKEHIQVDTVSNFELMLTIKENILQSFWIVIWNHYAKMQQQSEWSARCGVSSRNTWRSRQNWSSIRGKDELEKGNEERQGPQFREEVQRRLRKKLDLEMVFSKTHSKRIRGHLN